MSPVRPRRRSNGVTPQIILASASKRRSKILKECGIPHRVIVSGVSERMDPRRSAKENVLYNACRKAEKIAEKKREGFIIGADTIVLSRKRLIGKPKTRKKARALLQMFSGKTILVYTGLWVIDLRSNRSESACCVSKIRVKRLSREDIDKFATMAGPHDKAGGFSIEGPGAFIFDNIKGSFYNILGLPVMKLESVFKKLGATMQRA